MAIARAVLTTTPVVELDDMVFIGLPKNRNGSNLKKQRDIVILSVEGGDR